GDRLDLDGAVLDLGDFRLEQPADEVGVIARQDDFYPMSLFADVEDDRLDALADMVSLAGDLFAARQERFGLADVHRGGATLEALDGPGEQVAFLGDHGVEQGGALELADLLNNHLLGRLGGDAPK